MPVTRSGGSSFHHDSEKPNANRNPDIHPVPDHGERCRPEHSDLYTPPFDARRWRAWAVIVRYRPSYSRALDPVERQRGYVRAIATMATKLGVREKFVLQPGMDLRYHVTSSDAETRHWAEIGLAAQNETPRAERYLKLLTEASRDLRRAAAKQIHKMVTPALAKASLPALVLGLEDEDPVVRSELAAALGKLGAAARLAVPALKDHLQDAEKPVRDAVAVALRAIAQ